MPNISTDPSVSPSAPVSFLGLFECTFAYPVSYDSSVSPELYQQHLSFLSPSSPFCGGRKLLCECLSSRQDGGGERRPEAVRALQWTLPKRLTLINTFHCLHRVYLSVI